jgi:2-succinyl-5-enolpyruvyl-6-hydroxy-3-cyclohexene-1-carboxylate synthase
MSDTAGPNPSTAQAGVLVDELVRGGIADVVLCPGSRSAPLALALDAADRAGRLRLHVRIDERGAGFLAVGIAVRARRPVAVVCTSGTAVANLHPAVLEASHAGAPLLVLSADRPAELVGSGASQTVDQSGLFGGAVRLSLRLAPAERRVGDQQRWRAAVSRAVAACTGHSTANPGPVQLNVEFREPLTPEPAPAWPEPLVGRAGGAPWTAVAPRRHDLPELPLDPTAPTLLIAGDGTVGPIPTHVPLVAEPTSPTWPFALRGGAWLLGALARGRADHLRPEQVVILGRPTLHRAVQTLLADPDIAVHAVPGAERAASPEWVDTRFTVRAVGALPAGWTGPTWFSDRWTEADTAAGRVLDDALDAATPGLDGLRLARRVTDLLPPRGLLFAGPSNPVRDLALGARPRGGVAVQANRGVAGIDGVVSSAVGAALAHGGPAHALLGDLTTLHDVTALSPGALERQPDLVLVVASDDGGSVFTLLEQGADAHAASFERVFGTPHGLDLGAVARAHGVGHVRRSLDDLADLTVPGDGLRLLEIPIDRAHRREAHRRLTEEVGAVLGAHRRADAVSAR